MGVRLITDYDQRMTAMYDSTTGVAFGPVFEGFACIAQAEEFIEWFASGDAARAASTSEKPIAMAPRGADDPRNYTTAALVDLLAIFLAEHENEHEPIASRKADA